MVRAHCDKEERANAATHAVGLGFALPGAVAVVMVAIRHGQAWQISGCVLYAVTLVAMYAASTASHVFQEPRVRHVLRVLDQATIFLFIAGSYTPVALTWLRDGPWWIVSVAIWSIALAGFAGKAIFIHKVHPGSVSVVMYLVLGWLPSLLIWPLAKTIPVGLTLWIIGGGLCYTFGIIFFHFDRRFRYFHAAWHVMVIAGSTCHYLGILIYCTQPVT